MRPVKRILVGALMIATVALTVAANPGMAGSVSAATAAVCSFSDVGPATLSYSGSLNGDTAVTVHFHGKASCTGGAYPVYAIALGRITGAASPHLGNCTIYHGGYSDLFPKFASDGSSACDQFVSTWAPSSGYAVAASHTFQLKSLMTPCSTNSTWAYPNYYFPIEYAYFVPLSDRPFGGVHWAGVAMSPTFKLWWGCFN